MRALRCPRYRRVWGGSKATLSGDFQSEEQLFVEVAKAVGETHLAAAFAELERSVADVPVALQRFGEKTLGFLSQPDALATQRMVIAESGHDDIGQRYFEVGSGRGLEGVTRYLQAAMGSGRLRAADARMAAQHLLALFQAETWTSLILGVPVSASCAHLRQTIERALEVFLAAYGVPGLGKR